MVGTSLFLQMVSERFELVGHNWYGSGDSEPDSGLVIRLRVMRGFFIFFCYFAFCLPFLLILCFRRTLDYHRLLVRSFLFFCLGSVDLDWAIWFLQALHVVFFVAHYGASISYRDIGA